MSKLIWCVPNFSEGRSPDVIEKIADAISSASGVKVVNYSLDSDHNRAVITFIGAPEDVRLSMVAGAREAVRLIDISKHQGGHPRVGAVDVLPVVPLQDSTMYDAIALAREIGGDLASGLSLPVFFYEQNATSQHRVNLANIRRGGFEALKISGLTGDRAPDLGPNKLHPTAGAVVVGARGPLIAYNVNLTTSDINIAHKIASNIRKLRESGEGMMGVKAIGVHLTSRDIAQVSTNITRPDLTGIWEVYSYIQLQAQSLGVDALCSEMIGVVRKCDLPDSLRSAIRLTEFSEAQIIDNWL